MAVRKRKKPPAKKISRSVLSKPKKKPIRVSRPKKKAPIKKRKKRRPRPVARKKAGRPKKAVKGQRAVTKTGTGRPVSGAKKSPIVRRKLNLKPPASKKKRRKRRRNIRRA